ncbi:hypothetical protein HOY82DRAFT_75196 [Tuber indicum]|nr:hypothetical protein HOY82DRAFT_75196 [Tuber indicum]
MASKIFKEIKDAVKTRTPDFLSLNDVEQTDFDEVMRGLRLPANRMEEYAYRVHWFRRERFLKITMPTKLHESASAWLYGEISKGLATGTIPYAWINAITISGSPEFSNFKGEYKDYSKEADMTIVPLLGPDWTKDREFPTLVLESGWTEPADRLKLDATL